MTGDSLRHGSGGDRRTVYLDYNATAPMRPEVRQALDRALDEMAGNPSSVHQGGRRARAMVDEARERVAIALGVSEGEVVFTSGGTESNNLAILGFLGSQGPKSTLAVSVVEHPSVLGAAARWRSGGGSVVPLPVDPAGRLVSEELEGAVRGGASLVSVAAANNELGVLADLEGIREVIAGEDREGRTLLHTDGVQALGRIPIREAIASAELVTLSAHKVGGPMGVGVLVKRAGVPLRPLLEGGGQEAELRPGTENVPAIVAGSVAIELAVRGQGEEAPRLLSLARELWAGIAVALPGARLLGPSLDDADRLPNTLCVLLPGADGRVLVAGLDLEGLFVSSGSACSSGSLEPSHVLKALGLPEEDARAGLRLSLGWQTTREDIHMAVDILRTTVSRGRKSSGRVGGEPKSRQRS